MNTHPFEQFCLSKPILRAVTEERYQQPTPIQVAAIPEVLEGRDVLATAQTGKTAAFALPILDRLYLQPPREQFGGACSPFRVFPSSSPLQSLASGLHEVFL